MPTFRLILCGLFADADGTKTPIDFPEFGNATIRGFYTTRIVDADDCDQAGPLAADSIHKELSESFVKALGYTLEIESCEDVTGVVDPGPRRGFSFFTEE